jgi:MscS family membrane protein
MLLEAVGVRVSALIAAIGVGGIGIALAAQRTVENLFGGLAVVGDRPIQEGDFCKFGDQQGTVERIGLWSTRLRTPERSVLTIPNAQFLSLKVENLQERDRILFNTTLRLRYETTPDQLRWVLVRLCALIDAHPRLDPDTSRVRFSGFGASSLDVELFVYVRTRDGNEFLAVREDLCLRVMDVVAAAGTAFALPAQTNYSGSTGIDPERAGAAAAEVQRWRTEGKLPLPDFPLKTRS